MPKLQPKEIWMVDLPDTQAHEQMGDRPAIVIAVHQESGMTMVVPFTKNQDYTRFPYILSKEVKYKRSYPGFSSPNFPNALFRQFSFKIPIQDGHH